jgi:hypothetical protein
MRKYLFHLLTGLVFAMPLSLSSINYIDDRYVSPNRSSNSLTSSTTLDHSARFWYVDGSSGDIIITLPDANFCNGQEYKIKRTDGSLNNVSVFNSQGIDDGTSFILEQNDSQTVKCNRADNQWYLH